MELNDILCIKVRRTICAVQLDNIIYLEKKSRTITAHVIDGDDLRFYGKYDSVMPFLDGRFTHPHQSYVINMQHISRLGRHEVIMYGGDRIVLGNKCFGRLKRAYDAFTSDNLESRRREQTR